MCQVLNSRTDYVSREEIRGKQESILQKIVPFILHRLKKFRYILDFFDGKSE
jgi:hypothetical protein